MSLHLCDDRDQRAVNHLVHACRRLARQTRLEAPPQPERHIGILGGIARRGLEIDLGETALRLAGADHILERDTAVRQVRRGEFVHAMAVQARIEIEAHHDRVVERRDVQPTPAQHDHVVFEIVADLQDARILEQGLQLRQRHCAIELHRNLGEHVRAAMRERDVAGEVEMQRHAHPDQLGAGRIHAGRLGIDRDPALMPRDLDPAVERSLVHHRLILVMRAGRVFLLRHDDQAGVGMRRGDRRIGHRREFGEQRLETMMLEERAQRGIGNALQHQIVERFGQRHVAFQIDQHARQSRHLGMLDQIVAQLAQLHSRGGRQHGFEVAMFEDQLGCGLRPHARHTRHVIDAVPHQGQHIAQLRGHDAEELLRDMLSPEPAVVHRVVQIEPGFDQLHQILVR